jgi:hypothetical protein
VGGSRAQRIDAAADQVELAVTDHHVAIGQLHLAGADGLDLPAFENHAGFESFFDQIVVAGTPVLGDRCGHRGCVSKMAA